MKLLYDGFIYRAQEAGGINRYFANLISRLPSAFEPTLTTTHQREFNFPSHPRLRLVTSPSLGIVPATGLVAAVTTRLRAPLSRFDLLHPTYYSLLSKVGFGKIPVPVVLTVHDMIHERFPQDMDPSGAVAREKREAIRRADAIICVSNNTRQDLLELYPVSEESVFVIHLATEMSAPRSSVPDDLPPYFLYIGARHRYKNFSPLLEAFRRVVNDHDVTLRVVGAPFGRSEIAEMESLGVADRVEIVGPLSDHQLATAYRDSVALVYPSLYEGFGIPPLEAMACGTAVIASNSSSIPEVVGDAGLLFDPYEIDELEASLRVLLEQPGKRQSLVDAGKRRAQSFSWERTAAATVKTYHEVAG